MVTFSLAIQLEYAISGPSDFVFNFHPANTPQQRVTDEYLRVTPTTPPHIYWIEADPVHGNRNLRLRAEAGSLMLSYEAVVDVRHHFEPQHLICEMPVRNLPPEALQYIYPSRYCQSDALPATVVAEFAGMAPGYARVQAICEWVRSRTRFLPGATRSSTCALDTLRDGVGVCRDFAHLMIALCRALNIPARFATGIDYGADPALGPTDFHAYVEVFLGERWYIFDPTGISPPAGLLRIGTGRDAGDVAFATIFGAVQGGAPKIHIEASETALKLPANQAVSTAGERPVSVDASVQGSGAGARYAPAAAPFQFGERDTGIERRGLSYMVQARPTFESAERR